MKEAKLRVNTTQELAPKQSIHTLVEEVINFPIRVFIYILYVGYGWANRMQTLIQIAV